MRPRPLHVGIVLAGLLLASCGTRVPDSGFAAGGAATGAAGGVAAGGRGLPAGSRPAVPVGPAGSAEHPAAGSAGSAGTGPAGAVRAGGARAGGAAAGNNASDVGVTATSITLGTISSRTNPFDPSAFVGPLYGAQAFVDDVNRRGGIGGRTVRLLSCDDSGDGGRDNECVHELVDNDRVFALVSNAIFRYDGAAYVQSAAVPDVGSQPIDTAYDRYSHLWDLYGESYPRNGTIGYGGQLEGGTEVYRYFKDTYRSVPRTAGVVYYNQADSQRYAQDLIAGLRVEGFSVVAKQVNFALPDYDSAVLDMKSSGVRYVYDVLDAGGNQNLCASMDSNGLSDQIVAKVTTTQSWVASIRADYASAPTCRNKIFATGNSRNYEDTGLAQVAAFRAAMSRSHTDGPTQLSEWALEGWAGAQWLADAMASCGPALTRRCVERYLSRPARYDGHGLLTPRSFTTYPPRKSSVACLNVARWQDAAHNGGGGWVTQVRDMDANCVEVPNVYYTP